MGFCIRWTDPAGAREEPIAYAKTAAERYVELLGQGHTGVEILDHDGNKLTAQQLAQLVAFGKKAV